jgi:hypothetical protein
LLQAFLRVRGGPLRRETLAPANPPFAWPPNYDLKEFRWWMCEGRLSRATRYVDARRRLEEARGHFGGSGGLPVRLLVMVWSQVTIRPTHGSAWTSRLVGVRAEAGALLPRLQDLASIGAAAPPSPSPSPRNPAQGMTDLPLFPMIFLDQIAPIIRNRTDGSVSL